MFVRAYGRRLYFEFHSSDQNGASILAYAAKQHCERLIEQSLDGRAHIDAQPILDRIAADLAQQERGHGGICRVRFGLVFMAVAAAG